MIHKTFEELNKLIEQAAENVEINGIYSHYKDSKSRYRVTGISIIEADDSIAVKYASLLAPKIEFIRPINSWLEKVSWQDKTLQRFKQIS